MELKVGVGMASLHICNMYSEKTRLLACLKSNYNQYSVVLINLVLQDYCLCHNICHLFKKRASNAVMSVSFVRGVFTFWSSSCTLVLCI